MKKLFFLTLACGGAMLLNGAELKLQSAADGMLIDRNGADAYAGETGAGAVDRKARERHPPERA